MQSPDRHEPVNTDELRLREAAVKLVNDGKIDLATRWTFLADWPSDFDASAVAAAWDMESDSVSVIADLQELEMRGLIQFDQASTRYKLNEVMKRVAAGLFGQ